MLETINRFDFKCNDHGLLCRNIRGKGNVEFWKSFNKEGLLLEQWNQKWLGPIRQHDPLLVWDYYKNASKSVVQRCALFGDFE